MRSQRLFLFGDQTGEILPSLQDLTRSATTCRGLGKFLDVCTEEIRNAINGAPARYQGTVPQFSSVLELATVVEETKSTRLALNTALLCVAQFGHTILHLEAHPTALQDAGDRPAVVGICTGLLTAAAICCCNTLPEVLEIAPKVIALAFRVGLGVSRRSELIDVAIDSSWATVVSNIDIEAARKTVFEFNSSRFAGNSPRQLYISAQGLATVTVSGPPAMLADLLQRKGLFQNSKKVALPIQAAFHAKHLAPLPLDMVLAGLGQELLDLPVRHGLLLSSSAGEPYRGKTFSEVLQWVIADICQNMVSFEAISTGLGRVLDPNATLYTFGPVTCAKAIKQSLQSRGIDARDSEEGPERARPRPEYSDNDVAIVGMAVRLPGSETLEEFWQVLEEGRDLHEKIRPDRFDVETHCDPTGKAKNTTLTPYGVFIDRPGFFDARLFNMSPREAAQTDPQQRLMLLTTYEALEMSGYSPNRTPATQTRRIGSWMGQTGDDWRDVNASQKVDTYFITGGIRAFGPGRLNYHFGWEGPSYSIDTACSSSAAAIQQGYSALLAGECDMAVGGGANFLSASDLFAGLSRGSFLSKTGGCKTFDHDADGYVRADAVGVIVMKRMRDAIADNDNVLAVLKAAVTNHSAEAISITHPHAETQERLFTSTLNKAGLRPHDIDYGELHGTGTQAGDATESRSVTNVLARDRTASNPLYIGTAKPNLGHGEAGSGVTSLIKAILMMKYNMIPPHVGIKGRINQKLPNLKELNTHISFGKTPFHPRANGDGKRRILINNFDAAGGNTSMVIEDGPKAPAADNHVDSRSHHIVVVSGKTPKAILGNVQRLIHHARRSVPGFRLQDLAYTTTARRMHHVLRQAYPVSSVDRLLAALEKTAADEPWTTKSSSRGPKPPVVFVFTGQGSQYAGMAAELFATHPTFRETLEECNQICVSKGAPSFLELLTGASSFEDSMARASPAQVQLAIVSIEVALAALWKSWGVSPTAVVGHSLGELAALHVAGVLSLHDCLYIVSKRAALVEQRCTPGTHAMLAVQKTALEAAGLLQERAGVGCCEIACLNGPAATVLSGPVESIQDLHKQVQSTGSKATILQTQFAFHSAQMDPILDEYRALAKDVHFAKPTISFVSTLLGEVVTEEGILSPDYLARQTREPVQFSKALSAIKALPELVSGKPVIWVETGPGPVCLGFIRSVTEDGDLLLPSIKRGEADWKTLTGSVAKAYSAGLDINWQEFHRPFERSLRLVDLPRYAFDLKNYWIQYEGDWALRKGDPSPAQPTTSSTDKKTEEASFSTTGLHRVESILEDSAMVSVTFATEASEPKLNKALRGHLVNGAGLCPSSVYADMAFTAAKYLWNIRIKGASEQEEEISLDVRDMAVDKPLLIKPGNTNQIIRVKATMSKSGVSSPSPIVEINFSSQDGEQKNDHAHCTVSFGQGSKWKSEWARQAYLIKSRMDLLIASSSRGEAHRLLRPMVYKLFASFVDYTDKYQGMEEVHIDSSALEATANVEFRATNGGDDGSFTYSPYWIDGLTHLSGFVLNGTEATPADSVFISHGWESLRIVGELSADKRYQSYVRMQPTEKSRVLAGDVYFFDGDEVVAVCQGLKFQQVKRTVLNSLLPTSGTSAAVRTTAVPVPTKAAVGRSAKTREAEVVAKASTPDRLALVRFTIASEVGIDLVELTDEANFADLGIDSLLSITITDRLTEALGLPIPATLFHDCQNMKDIQAHFGQVHGTSSTENIPLSGPGSSNDSSDLETVTCTASDSSTGISTASMQTPCDGDEKLATAIGNIIASEVGVDVSEIDKTAPLSDIGVDSLLTLAIMEAIKTQTGRTFPSSFLTDNPTLAAIEVALCGSSSPPPPGQLSRALGQIQQVNAPPTAQQAKQPPKFQARARLLQSGTSPSSSSTDPPLFLLPDGSGSASSYVGLPRLHLSGAVYGLDSPFLSDPAAFHPAAMTLERAAALYVDEMRRIQPRGPYRIGGWSIGGSYAFEAAAQLLRDHGEVVSCLVLIDAPCPATLPPLPLETVELLEGIGAFDGLVEKRRKKKKEAGGKENEAAAAVSSLREGVRQHFAGSIGALEGYRPRAVPSGMTVGMRVSVIWARFGVWQTVGEDARLQWERNHAGDGGVVGESPASGNAARDWIMDPRRVDCGPDGWDILLPGADISCVTVAGDHFGIMMGQGIVDLGREIVKAMS
ncbi:conidial yellow pigment biosynthesis polyketide synthase [Diaporthe helianthi]|uniref:Conidial yellow pigment biosynthesis polyketide synthase n=1 Tax=Diaporthe helianthi TaxID=158607 RepID=A0A1C1WY67_DIAHE|nr:polyketide synthase 8 [Diaporthe helianthi]POS74239.1 conidial yellow pigment biosynthesis polyketide synthase [Diaporthe helianthi]